MSDEPYLSPCPITHEHVTEAFACGNADMDAWLRRHALNNEGKVSRTYVVTDHAKVVVAYYALATGKMDLCELPRRIRHNLPRAVPVIVLGRLAVDLDHGGMGLGSCLLREAMQRCLEVSQVVGVRALVVHAIDDEAVEFYRRFGFEGSKIGPRTLLLPIETITQALTG